MSGSLEMMKITGYTDEEFSSAFEGSPYTVMMNPDTIKWNAALEYNSEQTPNSKTPSQKYKSTPADELSFDIVIDGTGIVDSKRVDLVKEIGSLKKIIFQYHGKNHRPNFVKIQWGKNIIFKGVLKSMNTSFTLFKPDGDPLRAKISLAFTKYVSAKTAEKEAKKQSPDVSHIVNVVQGDTLPQLCGKIWNDSSYYVQVAKFNKLNKFRHLKAGKQLIFPPIIQAN